MLVITIKKVLELVTIKKVIELAEVSISIVIEQIYSLSVVFFLRQ